MELVFQSPVPPARGLWIWRLLLTALLSVGSGESAAHVFITLIPEAPFVGGDAVLSVSVNAPFQRSTWYRAPRNAIFPFNVILTYNLETLKKPTIGSINNPNIEPINNTNIGLVNKPHHGPIYKPNIGPINNTNIGPINKPNIGPINNTNIGPINNTNIGLVNKPNIGPINNPSLGPKHTGREVALQNGSLRITNLRASDAGDYTVQIMTRAGPVQTTVHLVVSDTRTSVKSGSQPRLDRTTAPTALRAMEKAGVLAGAVLGAVIGAVLLTTTAVLIYKRRRNARRRRRNQPIPPPRRDLKIHSHRPSVGTDGYVDPREIHAPLHPYETVLPYPYKEQASPTPEEEHVYTELEYADGTLYNNLRV